MPDRYCDMDVGLMWVPEDHIKARVLEWWSKNGGVQK